MINASPNRPLRVFLCHASNDKPAVRELYRRLTADGFAPWLDEEKLLAGHDWEHEIRKAVRSSDVVIVCLSRKAITKEGFVQKEIRVALDMAEEKLDSTIFLIPLRLEECDVPDRLSRWHWVNQFEANGYARLVQSLRMRADELGLSGSSTTSAVPLTPQPFVNDVPLATTTISGGVGVTGQQVNIGNDVVGRDKITQTTINIAQVTIIPPGVAAVHETQTSRPNPIDNRRVADDMEFVRVPAGRFNMGSMPESQFASANERPLHTVEIPYDYWIARYPVSNEQFARFVTASKYRFDLGQWRTLAQHPVVRVSWRDAMNYCRWLSDLSRSELGGLSMRLPTEVEWEKAARGIDGRVYPWGDDWDQTRCNSLEIGRGGVVQIGSHSPLGDSPYGAADMAGNVWEWCHSLYKPYPYLGHDGREDSHGGDWRVARGGSWLSLQDYVRCAYRFCFRSDLRYEHVGFRCVISCALV